MRLIVGLAVLVCMPVLISFALGAPPSGDENGGANLSGSREEVSLLVGAWKVAEVTGDEECERDSFGYSPEEQYFTFNPGGAGQFDSLQVSMPFLWVEHGNRLDILYTDGSFERFAMEGSSEGSTLTLTRSVEHPSDSLESETQIIVLWRP